MGPKRKVVSDRALELGTRIAKRESQLELICLVANDTNLVNSKILPSVQPSVGIKFHHKDIEKKKIQILQGARTSIINECSVIEATRDIKSAKMNLNRILRRVPDQQKIEDLIRINQVSVKKDNLKRLQSKVSFHLDKSKKDPFEHSTLGKADWTEKFS